MLACRSATGKSWRARKRQACDEGARVDKQGIVSDDAIAEDVSSLWLPMDCTGTYNMDVLAERESLALTLWRGDYAESHQLSITHRFAGWLHAENSSDIRHAVTPEHGPHHAVLLTIWYLI